MAEFVYIQGKAKWFKHMVPEVFKGKGAWKHTIYPNEESMEKLWKLKKEGMKNDIKKDEDGYYINFRRPTEIVIKDKITQRLKDIQQDPPVVMGPQKEDMTRIPVGNGSDITTKLEVYEHSVPGSQNKAKAARWMSTRVDHLVVYENSKQEAILKSIEERPLKGLAEQPEQKAEEPF